MHFDFTVNRTENGEFLASTGRTILEAMQGNPLVLLDRSDRHTHVLECDK